jgi:hypothetical protein
LRSPSASLGAASAASRDRETRPVRTYRSFRLGQPSPCYAVFHDILKYVLSRVRVSPYLNMFGYDDGELNDIVMAKALDPSVTMLIALDKSQAGGKHEETLLDADRKHVLAKFNTYFTIGQSSTHQISHTKGFVADAKVGGDGSVNWSAAGEGTFVVTGQPGGPGFKAQNNTDDLHRSGLSPSIDFSRN